MDSDERVSQIFGNRETNILSEIAEEDDNISLISDRLIQTKKSSKTSRITSGQRISHVSNKLTTKQAVEPFEQKENKQHEQKEEKAESS